MKKVLICMLIILGAGELVAQTATAPSVGDGSAGNPYQIATLENLYWISQNSGTWGSYFIQTADIDASDTSGWDDGDGGDPEGWTPIGNDTTRFTGFYDGQEYVVAGLYIDRPPSGNQGLFGHIGDTTAATTIENLGIVNATVKGARGSGTLIGRVTGNADTLIECCFAVGGSVEGDGATGGLIGSHNSWRETAGGTDNPIARYCYADVAVSFSGTGAGDKFGGLAGCSEKGTIIDSYARGSVTVTQVGTLNQRVGGLAGCIEIRGELVNSYSTGLVDVNSSCTRVGGLVGNRQNTGAGNAGVVTDCFWDTNTSDQVTSDGGSPTNTAGMTTQATFTDAGWDFTTVWAIDPDVNDGYPYLQCSPLPTSVLVTDFRAVREGGETWIEWTTGSEVGTIGFRLLRWDADRNAYVQAGRPFLPAMIGSPQGGEYRLRDPHADPSGAYRYKLVEIETGGGRNMYGPFDVAVPSLEEDVTATGRGTERKAAAAGLDHGYKVGRLEAGHPRKHVEKPPRGKAARVAGRLKLQFESPGVYRVNSDTIAAGLGISPKWARLMLQQGKLALSCGGKPVPYERLRHGSGLIFYGQAIDSIYTDQNVAWLKPGHGQRMAVQRTPPPKGEAAGGCFTERRHIEQDVMPMHTAYMDPRKDCWIWQFLAAGVPGMYEKTFEADLPGVAATQGRGYSKYRRDSRPSAKEPRSRGSQPRGYQYRRGSEPSAATPDTAELTARLHGGSASGLRDEHHVVIAVNGIAVGEGRWTGTTPYELHCTFSQELLRSGANTITVKALQDDGVPYSLVLVDGFDVTYQRTLEAEDNRLLFQVEGRSEMTVGGFTDGSIRVMDLSDPDAPALVANTRVQGADGDYRVTFSPPRGSRTCYAWSEIAEQNADVQPDAPSNLRSPANAADYVVITDDPLTPAAAELAAWRRGQGLRTRVVTYEDICDEFNHGIASPEAIRVFLAYASRFWAAPPLYVVLAGDGTYDYKDILDRGRNILPAVLVRTPEGLFASDNWYADFDADGMPETAVGRLPAATAEELHGVVAKLKGYAAEPPGDWTERALLAADNPDEGGDFTVDSELLAERLPTDYTIDRVYLETMGIAAARRMIVDDLNEGQSLFQYVGHANLNQLAAEGMFSRGHVGQLTNESRLPVMVAATCMVGMFSQPGYTALSERMLMHDSGGAMAVWSPSGSAFNEHSTALLQAFLRMRFEEGEAQLGPAIMGAIREYRRTGQPAWLPETFVLLGDPAMRMK